MDKTTAKPWSRRHPRCVECGATTERHKGKGLCAICYERAANKRLTSATRDRIRSRSVTGSVTREYLIQNYCEAGKSLADIAADLHCTRQLVLNLMKKFGVERRSGSGARRLAMEKGKITFTIQDSFGNDREIRHTALKINRGLFATWSDDLAYILGMIYTDGNLLKDYFSTRTGRRPLRYQVSISQKDPTILHQIRNVLGLNRTVYRTRNNQNDFLYNLMFSDREIFEQLEILGLCSNKSRIIKFPQMVPKEYIGGFLRGLFDGDGTYSVGRVRFATGSRDFAVGLGAALETLGFRASISTTLPSDTRKHSAYTVLLSSKRLAFPRFFELLYSSANLYLERKRRQLAILAGVESETTARGASPVDTPAVLLAEGSKILGLTEPHALPMPASRSSAAPGRGLIC